MIEFLDLLVSNSKEANRNIYESWVGSTIDIAWWIGIVFGCCYILSWLWDFIDDKKADFHKLFLAPLGILFVMLVADLIIVTAIYALVWFFAHTLYQIPLIWFAWLGGIVFTILLARYVRRTHKVIHRHVKDPNAHTDKANKDVEKLSNSLNKDPYFYNMEE